MPLEPEGDNTNQWERERAEAFMLKEYEALWRDHARSQASSETAARFLLLVFGGLAGLLALLPQASSLVSRHHGARVSPGTVQLMGIAMIRWIVNIKI